MLQSVLTKLSSLLPNALLLLFLVGGYYDSANAQKSNPDSIANRQLPATAQKTSDLSGMWMLPQIHGPAYNTLHSLGITLSSKELYSPTGNSFNRAVAKIKIGDNQAGTGSFVSPNGLLLTNYNSAIQGIAQNSKQNQNYIHEGFFAQNQEQEIPLNNYLLLITIEQKEVTQQINRQLPDSLTFRQRRKQKQEIEKQIIAKRQAENDKLLVEINDTWAGNRQFMSVYKIIRDVRLVHASPNPELNRSKNFAILRAYVSPGGQSKTYSKSNVPYQPQKVLSIADKEATAHDIALTLGYPGETQRYESSYATKFYLTNRNPVLIEMYKAIIDAAQYAADQDSSAAIENAPLRSSLIHNLNYYQAIQEGIKKYNIISKKQSEEENFTKWVKQDSLRNIKYRRVLNQIEQSYSIASQTGDLLFALVNTINSNKILQIAGLYNSYYEHVSDTSNTAISNAKKQELLNQHQNILNSMNADAQTGMLEDMLYSLSSLPDGKVPFHLIELFGGDQDTTLRHGIQIYLQKQRSESILFDLNRALQFLNLSADSVRNHPKDKLVTLYEELLSSYQFSRQNYSQHVPYLLPAQELYVKGLLTLRGDSLSYPDANGTMRMSIGRVKKSKNKSSSVHFVSTNDITGGSFGSPVLNSKGKLVGIVVNRSSASMVNDLHYMPELSHTVNLDIRHIISRISESYKTQSLLKEMLISGTETN